MRHQETPLNSNHILGLGDKVSILDVLASLCLKPPLEKQMLNQGFSMDRLPQPLNYVFCYPSSLSLGRAFLMFNFSPSWYNLISFPFALVSLEIERQVFKAPMHPIYN